MRPELTSPPPGSRSHSCSAFLGGLGALLRDVYGDLTPKENALAGSAPMVVGDGTLLVPNVASRAGATVDGHICSYNFEQWVNGDGG